MEAKNGNTISLIMEVEEIAPEEPPSDSDTTECVLSKSAKKGLESTQDVPTNEDSVSGAVNDGKECEQQVSEETPLARTGQNIADAGKGPGKEAKVLETTAESGETQPSVEENVTTEEGKKQPSEQSDTSPSKSGQSLEEQLTELFRDKSDSAEVPSKVTTIANSPMEESLIAIFEEEDSRKSLSNQVGVSDLKSAKKDLLKSPEIASKQQHFEKGSLLLDKDIQMPSNDIKSSCEKGTVSLKRRNSDKEAHQVSSAEEMKEMRVVLKKLKLPLLEDHSCKLSELPSEILENKTQQQSVCKSDASFQSLNENASKGLASKKSTPMLAKNKVTSKTAIPSESPGQQVTPHTEEIKRKPKKQPIKIMEAAQDLAIKNKINEPSKVVVRKGTVANVGKRKKRGRPPLNKGLISPTSDRKARTPLNKGLISPMADRRGRPPLQKALVLPPASSPTPDKRKPIKTIVKPQELPLASRVSERLQLKMMKTRAVRKKKLYSDKHEGTKSNIRKSSQKSEHILNLQNTAISLAKRRKTAGFSSYSLAKKKRLLNAVKSVTTTKKQPSQTLVDVKHPPVRTQANIASVSKPVLKTKKNKNTFNKENSAENGNVKTSHSRAETSIAESEAPRKIAPKKSDNKTNKPQQALKDLKVTKTNVEVGKKALQQQNKGVKVKSAVIGAVKTVTADAAKKGKDATIVRNNNGIVEMLVEDVPHGEATPRPQRSATVDIPSGMTDAEKMMEMRKAIWNLETRIDRYKLRQQAEERMVVYLSNKLQLYESNKHVQALMRMLKDAAPGPKQNQDAVFITDLLLGYCPESDNCEES